MNVKRLPIGYDSFEKIRTEKSYYVDKTYFIKEFLKSHGEVTLFTRPRRFGKTLLMSMLKSFFSIHSAASLFEGLAVSREKELCSEYQGKYPVIFISLKGVEGIDFKRTLDRLSTLLSGIYQEFSYLLDSENVDNDNKDIFRKIKAQQASEEQLMSALALLLRMLHNHYGKKGILLIDEYDVPLDKAYHNGCYEEMVSFIRGFLGDVLKTNHDLEFAVLTGCLRVSKESIFTGLNNFKIDTISDMRFAPYFGFTDREVRKILEDYHVSGAYDRAKEWYDGYRFGSVEVYCPWDVVNYVDLLRDDPGMKPRPFWINTSSNSIVRELITMADEIIKEKIEALIRGDSILVPVSENLTYGEIREDPDNLWSMLYLTGYLTLAGKPSGEFLEELVIPNKEICSIFVEQIEKWLNKSLYPSYRVNVAGYLFERDTEKLQSLLNDILIDTISYFDYKEDFYHAFLAGLLTGSGYSVQSNRENGLGRSDIILKDPREKKVVIMEVKHSKEIGDMERDCEKALKQIDDRNYAGPFVKRCYDVIKYGISFFEKECRMKAADDK